MDNIDSSVGFSLTTFNTQDLSILEDLISSSFPDLVYCQIFESNQSSVDEESHRNAPHGREHVEICGESDLHQNAPIRANTLEGTMETVPINTGNDRKPRIQKRSRERHDFNQIQKTILEERYRNKQYINRYERIQLADALKVNEQKVKCWFNNRRQRDKIIQKNEGKQQISSPLSESSPFTSPEPSPVYCHSNQSDQLNVFIDKQIPQDTTHVQTYVESCGNDSHQDAPICDNTNAQRTTRETITLNIENDKYTTCSQERSRERYFLNQTQKTILEEYYRHKRYIKPDERSILANALEVSEERVSIWFRNRRLRGDEMNQINGRERQVSSSSSELSSLASTASSPVYCLSDKSDQFNVIIDEQSHQDTIHVQIHVDSCGKSDFHQDIPMQRNVNVDRETRGTLALAIENKQYTGTRGRRYDFNQDQKTILEEYYRYKRYIKPDERSILANALEVNEEKVKIWFNNRRRKDKMVQQNKEKSRVSSSLSESSPLLSHAPSTVCHQSNQIEQFSAVSNERSHQIVAHPNQQFVSSTYVNHQMNYEQATYQSPIVTPEDTQFASHSPSIIDSNPYDHHEIGLEPCIHLPMEQSNMEASRTFNCANVDEEDLLKAFFAEYVDEDCENCLDKSFNIFEHLKDFNSEGDFAFSQMCD